MVSDGFPVVMSWGWQPTVGKQQHLSGFRFPCFGGGGGGGGKGVGAGGIWVTIVLGFVSIGQELFDVTAQKATRSTKTGLYNVELHTPHVLSTFFSDLINFA